MPTLVDLPSLLDSPRWRHLPTWDQSTAARYEPIVVLKKENSRIHDTARIDAFTKFECGEGLYIGAYVHIASFTHVLGGGICVFEDGSSAGSGCKVVTGSNVPGAGHGCSAIAPDAVVKRSFVHIKRNATLFVNVCVLPGVTVGEGATIAAGSVVTCDVPPGELWGGAPARCLRTADGLRARPVQVAAGRPTDDWLASMAEWYGW